MEFAAALPLKQHVTGPTSGAAVDIYEPFNPSGPISALLVTDPVIEQTRVTSMLLRLGLSILSSATCGQEFSC